MSIIVWILQILLALTFIFSGINKTYFNEETLIKKGQTGVEGLPKWFIKFIGISEILGAIALLIPFFTEKWTILVPIVAFSLGFIMIPAAFIHKKRKEYKSVAINLVILFSSCFVAFYWLNLL